MLRTLLNLLWVVLGGLPMALGWWLVALLCTITVVGLPWARSCWVIGRFSLWPFGTEAINRRTSRAEQISAPALPACWEM